MSISETRTRLHRAPALAVALVAGAALACSSPTAPDASSTLPAFQVANAQVSVEGAVVNGESFQMGQMTGSSTFFQATLMGPNGPVPGEAMQVQYQVPHNGPGGMMGGPGQGFMTLYDDGSHGDPRAGDGIYCFDDQAGQYGMHMHGAPAGTYHYEFFGVDHNQNHTDHMSVNVTLTAAATASSLRLSAAQVMVDGNVANGQTVHMGQMEGHSTFFQAVLTDADGPAPGETVQVHYQIPHRGPGMMGGAPDEGFMHLYDDGTHGDPVAGDGIYCFEDQQGQYGFHMHGAQAGQYHYEFFGIGHDQQHTNHMNVFVTLVS